MPRIRRIRRTRAIETPPLDQDLRMALLHGRSPLLTADDERTTTILAVSWETYRSELLAEWIAASPGTRPFAWWLCDAPEPRRELVTLTAGERRRNTRHGIMHTSQVPAIQESEKDYLRRHGLLTTAEESAP